MKTKLSAKLLKIEFEIRIFISLFIVAAVTLISYQFFNDLKSARVILGDFFDVDSNLFFIFAFIVMIFVSFLRMWAGSILSSKTVMSFEVRSEELIIKGPYLFVRNPIYFADFLAVLICSLFLPLTGLAMPVLFYLHYNNLILYEERNFHGSFNYSISLYKQQVPRLIPTPKSIINFIKHHPIIEITKDGIRHNALYLLFIVGFLVGYFTENFVTVILIGIAGIIDWAIVHTKIGMKKKIKVFNDILYSNCWEDPEIDRTAFKLNENDTILSITSGGCNLLYFLIDNPKKIIALDLNPYQNYLLELKIAAFKNLCYNDLLEFIGVKHSSHRLDYFLKVKNDLSPAARVYWEKNFKKIRKGIIHSGRYEKYMKFIRIIIYLLIGRKNVQKLFELNESERMGFYEKTWNNKRWRIFTKIFLSRKTMSLLFTGDFFKYLDKEFSFGEHFRKKFENAILNLRLKQNYFLSYILLGRYYDLNNLPPYLKLENFEKIRSRIERIEIVTGSCDSYLSNQSDSSISKFNFTNIFEWISETAFENLLRQVIRVALTDAVITYRNLLVFREHPSTLNDLIKSNKKLAGYLHSIDLSFIYDNYVIEVVRKEETLCSTNVSVSQINTY